MDPTNELFRNSSMRRDFEAIRELGIVPVNLLSRKDIFRSCDSLFTLLGTGPDNKLNSKDMFTRELKQLTRFSIVPNVPK